MTPFQQKVLHILLTVPKGKVITYGGIAERLGDKNLSRAVGNALHNNPDGELYPCYKVVDARGKLSHSYAFGGKEGQKRRLEADGVIVNNYQVDLSEFGYLF